MPRPEAEPEMTCREASDREMTLRMGAEPETTGREATDREATLRMEAEPTGREAADREAMLRMEAKPETTGREAMEPETTRWMETARRRRLRRILSETEHLLKGPEARIRWKEPLKCCLRRESRQESRRYFRWS